MLLAKRSQRSVLVTPAASLSTVVMACRFNHCGERRSREAEHVVPTRNSREYPRSGYGARRTRRDGVDPCGWRSECYVLLDGRVGTPTPAGGTKFHVV